MSNKLPNVRIQDARDFTVQIRHATADAIVGTGIAISTDGKIVTCSHVVRDAGVEPRSGNREEVGVYFPRARSGEAKAWRATVAAYFHQYDDDVVLLQLVGGPAPLAPEQIAVLGMAEDSTGHRFRSYGYRRLDNYIAGWTDGMIQGTVEAPLGRNVQAEPIQLKANQINRGMSGAAVLDIERNLVVGIVSETWFPDLSTKDSDTNWAVNTHVLTFNPFNLPVQSAPHPLRAAPEPKTDIGSAYSAAVLHPGIALNSAPPPLLEWVGRVELLEAISADWSNGERRVSGLIGFGGEGKSCLARHWLDTLLVDPSESQPDAVFWWDFYKRPSVDEFFEAALNFMSGGNINLRREYSSANARAHLIAAMLTRGRYLFILDGLEVLQYQDGDQYGLLKSADLREFLGYFAAPAHNSFCLITSRAPMLDLMDYTTYSHRDVTCLSVTDGRDLLRKLGVSGSDEALNQVVADWDGHALTLSLLGAYLAGLHGGNVAYIHEIPTPTLNEPRYERVHRVLRHYDEHLTDAERALLMLFSAFRTPIEESAIQSVFRKATANDALNMCIAVLDDAAFNAMIERLIKYRILRYDYVGHRYTMHPLIRLYYLAGLNQCERSQVQAAHAHIKNYYLAIAAEVPETPTLNDVAPLIEAVYHACRAGEYDKASRLLWERIDQRNPIGAVFRFGTYETELMLLLEFFPRGDISQEPQLSNSASKGWILTRVGICLMNIGSLRKGMPFYERALSCSLESEDWLNASISYFNLAELCAHLGEFAASEKAAKKGLALPRHAHKLMGVGDLLVLQGLLGWIAHLRGDVHKAREAFKRAEALQRKAIPSKRYLFGMPGILQANHLRRVGHPTRARRGIQANMKLCEDYSDFPVHQLSQCHCILGNLDADEGNYDSARDHFAEALKVARNISVRPALIEALLARGRWAARRGEVETALSDLREALDYATEGGYRVYEADIRVGLAWAHLAAGDVPAARTEAECAEHMSADMGYHWGKVDASEVLARLSQSD